MYNMFYIGDKNKKHRKWDMKKSNIIFDLDGVLFKENKLKIARKYGLGKMLFYLITYRKNPVKIGADVFKKMHEQWDQNSEPVLYYKKTPLPTCINHWMKGVISDKVLLDNIDKFIENLKKMHYFASEFEKNLVQQSIKVILDESEIATNMQPITPMIKLVENIKREGKHNIYIISNYAKHAADFLIEKNKEFFSLFDDIIISAEIGMIKPDREIFDYFLQKHNTEADKCVFIDDQEQNVLAAKQMGITSFQYKNFNAIRDSLQNLGII